ncbi:MAG TPA: hypothetical protein VK968_15550, partial [Roseimicrobium sp.]|nr:hypothetical protein [Roseimicrobium sp.]
DLTTRTNIYGEVEKVAGHEKLMVLWPFFFDNHLEIGTENPQHQQILFPFYAYTRAPLRDSTTYFWPFGLTITDEREKKYHEVGAPWPLIVFARGEGKTANRVWPIFGHAHNASLRSDFILWPIYKYNRLTSSPLDRERTRIFFFLYSDVSEKNTDSGQQRRRRDFWPLYTHQKDFNGNSRLQILAPVEPVLSNNKSIERDYSHLWSIWRSENNPKEGRHSESLLWNLYRRDTGKETRKCSLLFGLFQYQSSPAGQETRLFYIPVSRTGKDTSKPNPEKPVAPAKTTGS